MVDKSKNSASNVSCKNDFAFATKRLTQEHIVKFYGELPEGKILRAILDFTKVRINRVELLDSSKVSIAKSDKSYKHNVKVPVRVLYHFLSNPQKLKAFELKYDLLWFLILSPEVLKTFIDHPPICYISSFQVAPSNAVNFINRLKAYHEYIPTNTALLERYNALMQMDQNKCADSLIDVWSFDSKLTKPNVFWAQARPQVQSPQGQVKSKPAEPKPPKNAQPDNVSRFEKYANKLYYTKADKLNSFKKQRDWMLSYFIAHADKHLQPLNINDWPVVPYMDLPYYQDLSEGRLDLQNEIQSVIDSLNPKYKGFTYLDNYHLLCPLYSMTDVKYPVRSSLPYGYSTKVPNCWEPLWLQDLCQIAMNNLMGTLMIADRRCFLQLWALSIPQNSILNALDDFQLQNLGNLTLDNRKFLCMDDNQHFYKFVKEGCYDPAIQKGIVTIQDVIDSIFKTWDEIPLFFVIQSNMSSAEHGRHVQFLAVNKDEKKKRLVLYNESKSPKVIFMSKEEQEKPQVWKHFFTTVHHKTTEKVTIFTLVQMEDTEDIIGQIIARQLIDDYLEFPNDDNDIRMDRIVQLVVERIYDISQGNQEGNQIASSMDKHFEKQQLASGLDEQQRKLEDQFKHYLDKRLGPSIDGKYTGSSIDKDKLAREFLEDFYKRSPDKFANEETADMTDNEQQIKKVITSKDKPRQSTLEKGLPKQHIQKINHPCNLQQQDPGLVSPKSKSNLKRSYGERNIKVISGITDTPLKGQNPKTPYDHAKHSKLSGQSQCDEQMRDKWSLRVFNDYILLRFKALCPQHPKFYQDGLFERDFVLEMTREKVDFKGYDDAVTCYIQRVVKESDANGQLKKAEDELKTLSQVDPLVMSDNLIKDGITNAKKLVAYFEQLQKLNPKDLQKLIKTEQIDDYLVKDESSSIFDPDYSKDISKKHDHGRN